jgi:predicted RNA methylase
MATMFTPIASNGYTKMFKSESDDPVNQSTMNQHTIALLLGDLNGKTVLDAGCGCGVHI